jgi:hypothetical protein
MADVEADVGKTLDCLALAAGLPPSFETAASRPPQDEGKD